MFLYVSPIYDTYITNRFRYVFICLKKDNKLTFIEIKCFYSNKHFTIISILSRLSAKKKFREKIRLVSRHNLFFFQ